jgi:hypothetical protein
MRRCAGGIERDWIKLGLVDRSIDKGMLFIDVLAINLQIMESDLAEWLDSTQNGIRSGSRIDRATVGADIDERVRGRLATRRLLGQRSQFEVVSTSLRIPLAEHEASRACAFGKLRGVLSGLNDGSLHIVREPFAGDLWHLQPRDALR